MFIGEISFSFSLFKGFVSQKRLDQNTNHERTKLAWHVAEGYQNILHYKKY